MEALFFVIYFHYIGHMNETIIINVLLYFFFFILGVRFGRNIQKLENQKDEEE